MPQQLYRLNEIFYSLQGEGAHTGMAAVFVRLSGCSMGCDFCDTPDSVNMELTPGQIAEKLRSFPAQTVIITGGEPAEQDIFALSKYLKENEYSVHAETNGAIDFDRSFVDHLTVSPKKNVSEKMLLKADAVKIVTGVGTDLKELEKYERLAEGKRLVFLQPLSNKKENIDLCVSLVKKHPRLRLSLQTHKLINIP